MKQVKVVIGNKVWLMPRKQAHGLIQQVQESVKVKNMLIAVERDKTIVLTRECFETKEELLKEIAGYNKRGFKCYHTESKVYV